MINSEECYIAHYDLLFGKPAQGEAFGQGGQSTSIRVLGFDGAMEGCRTFCTLGLSHYRHEIDLLAEIYVPVDDGLDLADYVIALVLFELIGRNVKLRAGISVDFGSAVPKFKERFGKSALYFTAPFDLPDNVWHIPCGNDVGFLLLAVFISESENHYLLHEGGDRLNELFEANEVDPYNLRRPSVV